MNCYRFAMRWALMWVACVFFFAGLRAATTQDLGEGLAYFRVTNLDDDLTGLQGALKANKALVVDLRGVDAGMDEARALRGALMPVDVKMRVARFVLINGKTAAAIPFTLDAGLPDSAVPGVLIVAPDAAKAPADVKVAVSAEDDGLACAAIASGSAAASLINHQPEKKRYDESVLMREHEGVAEPEAQTDVEAAGAEKSTVETVKLPANTLTDSVLEVAVQTHRALVALKKL